MGLAGVAHTKQIRAVCIPAIEPVTEEDGQLPGGENADGHRPIGDAIPPPQSARRMSTFQGHTAEHAVLTPVFEDESRAPARLTEIVGQRGCGMLPCGLGISLG